MDKGFMGNTSWVLSYQHFLLDILSGCSGLRHLQYMSPGNRETEKDMGWLCIALRRKLNHLEITEPHSSHIPRACNIYATGPKPYESRNERFSETLYLQSSIEVTMIKYVEASSATRRFEHEIHFERQRENMATRRRCDTNDHVLIWLGFRDAVMIAKSTHLSSKRCFLKLFSHQVKSIKGKNLSLWSSHFSLRTCRLSTLIWVTEYVGLLIA